MEGLGFGLRIALDFFGIGARCVCYVEREFKAAEILVQRIKEGCLDDAPIWSDVRTFDGRPWRGRVDCIAGGFPCQDLSFAGKRAGIYGPKSGLWGEFARIIGEVRPRIVFIENVPGLLDNESMLRILGDLSALGFDAEWLSIRASDVGAPHQRERVFVLAYCAPGGCGELREPSTQRGRQSDGIGEAMADTNGRRQGICEAGSDVAHSRHADGRKPHPVRCTGWSGSWPSDNPGRTNPLLADAAEPGFPGWQNPSGDVSKAPRLASAERTGIGLPDFPPGPVELDCWDEIPPWLWPSVEPGIRVLADGLAVVVDQSRTDQLRACGNGVVPLQAAAAFMLLAERLEINLRSDYGKRTGEV